MEENKKVVLEEQPIKIPTVRKFTQEEMQEQIYNLQKQSEEILFHLQNIYGIIVNSINSNNENFDAIVKRFTIH